MGHSKESGMPEGDSAAVERVIANTINETARGDPDALAARIVAALGEGGFRIVPANGIEDTALGPKRAETRSYLAWLLGWLDITMLAIAGLIKRPSASAAKVQTQPSSTFGKGGAGANEILCSLLFYDVIFTEVSQGFTGHMPGRRIRPSRSASGVSLS
jgi:hypothetical protein